MGDRRNAAPDWLSNAARVPRRADRDWRLDRAASWSQWLSLLISPTLSFSASASLGGWSVSARPDSNFDGPANTRSWPCSSPTTLLFIRVSLCHYRHKILLFENIPLFRQVGYQFNYTLILPFGFLRGAPINLSICPIWHVCLALNPHNKPS